MLVHNRYLWIGWEGIGCEWGAFYKLINLYSQDQQVFRIVIVYLHPLLLATVFL